MSRFFRFCLVGASGVLVNYAVVSLCVDWIGSPWRVGWAAGIAVSMVSNYWGNKLWTFRSSSPQEMNRG